VTQSICLVAMPWQAIESPSLPLGLLRASCVRAGLPLPETYHGSLRWAEFVMDASAGVLGPDDYNDIAENGLFHGLGDWVFAGVLHGDCSFGVEQLCGYAAQRGLDINRASRMREYAEEFVDMAAREILAMVPDVVGFSTTFMQNVPSLAVAQRIKEITPDVLVVFGGGNCDGVMGAALHRNYRFVDYVVSGEGEDALPALLTALHGGIPLTGVPGLCWWDGDRQHRNEPNPHPLPPGRIPTPDFDDWFERIESSPIREYVEPKLIMETARGCWWGQVHHCTFCGLNGSLMQFRSKSADAVVDELKYLVSRHQVLDVIAVDNIIDNTYFRTVLPRIAELNWDLRIHYEVKSNLKPTEIDSLRHARVTHVQPGIESLVTPVLKIMDKGVRGFRNVRTLRDCESAALTVTWNWLYGFPGENFADYAPIMHQIFALVHLQPPSSAARILLERFSPYFENPDLGFPDRTTAQLYRHVYGLSESDVHDMVYLFDTSSQGLTDEDAAQLQKLLDHWSDGYSDSYLHRWNLDGAIVLRDCRVGWLAEDFIIEEPDFVAAYNELENGRTVGSLYNRLVDAGRNQNIGSLRRWIVELFERGLLFEENGYFVTLATTAAPIKVG
jgi:ribosomal peptide maturation radical SAM protein 1